MFGECTSTFLEALSSLLESTRISPWLFQVYMAHGGSKCLWLCLGLACRLHPLCWSMRCAQSLLCCGVILSPYVQPQSPRGKLILGHAFFEFLYLLQVIYPSFIVVMYRNGWVCGVCPIVHSWFHPYRFASPAKAPGPTPTQRKVIVEVLL